MKDFGEQCYTIKSRVHKVYVLLIKCIEAVLKALPLKMSIIITIIFIIHNNNPLTLTSGVSFIEYTSTP